MIQNGGTFSPSHVIINIKHSLPSFLEEELNKMQ